MRKFAYLFVVCAALTLLFPSVARADDDDDDSDDRKRKCSFDPCSKLQKWPDVKNESDGCAVIPRGNIENQLTGLAAFNYDKNGKNGPSNWAKLDCTSSDFKQFRNCSYCTNSCDGKRQSPINIVRSKAKKSSSSAPRIRLKKKVLLGYDIEPISFNLECQKSGKCGDVSFKGVKYKMISGHVHFQSEHQVDGKFFPLEVHLVHAAGSKLLVLGVFFRPGRFNPELQKYLNICKNRCIGNMDLRRLVRKSLKRKYLVNYEGSLTTPPCTETVTWIISTSPQEASPHQIEQYQNLTASDKDNRPVQPLNGRTLYTFK